MKKLASLGLHLNPLTTKRVPKLGHPIAHYSNLSPSLDSTVADSLELEKPLFGPSYIKLVFQSQSGPFLGNEQFLGNLILTT